MAIKQSEADLEARIHSLLETELSYLSEKQIAHQTIFAIKLGHKTVNVNGARLSGRSDILLKAGDENLAILELKRPSLELTIDDVRQGLSYARLCEPMAPLTIVSNGKITNIYATYTGEEISTDDQSSDKVKQLFSNVGKLASTDVSNAIAALSGPTSSCVKDVILALTTSEIDQHTGTWQDLLSPFVNDFHAERDITQSVFDELDTSKSVIIAGEPLSGKSNVLKDIVIRAQSNEVDLCLYLDAESTNQGIYQCLATQFMVHFGWPLSADDVRKWLLDFSNNQVSKNLILLIDNAASIQKSDIDEIFQPAFGAGLKCVFTLDDSQVKGFLASPSGRHHSKIAKTTKTLHLDFLSDSEFMRLVEQLGSKEIYFLPGAQRCYSYRQLWMLRSLLSQAIASPKPYPSSVLALSSVPHPEFILHGKINAPEDVLTQYSELAKAVLGEMVGDVSPIDLQIHRMSTYLCSWETARRTIGEVGLRELVDSGYIRQSLSGGERVVSPTTPQLLGFYIAQHLKSRLSDGKLDIPQLLKIATKLPNGVLIGAAALIQSLRNSENIRAEIDELVAYPMEIEQLHPGTKIGMMIEDSIIEIETHDDGITVRGPGGRTKKVVGTDILESTMLSAEAHAAKLIASYLSGVKIGNEHGSVNPQLICEIGSIPHVLIAEHDRILPVLLHQLPDGGAMVCHHEGIVEPISDSILHFFTHDADIATEIIRLTVSDPQLPLLSRVLAALRVCGMTEERERWAKEQMSHINPLIEDSVINH